MRRHDLRDGRSGGWGRGGGGGTEGGGGGREGGQKKQDIPAAAHALWSKIAEIWPGALGLPDSHSVQYAMYNVHGQEYLHCASTVYVQKNRLN
jgi:hypothetical protein